MKRLSLLKKIALGSGVVAAVAPLALMTTSCAIEDIAADYIDFNSVLFNQSYSNASIGSQSFKRLLFGSKKVHGGNYILFYGSNTFNNTCKFFSGDEYIRGRDQWFTNWSKETPEGCFNFSPFFYGIQKTAGTAYKNFGIFNVIDFFDFKVYDNKGHRIYISDKEDSRIDVISPWAKWTDNLITQTKKYNASSNVPEKYEWDEKSVTAKTDYIRNDAGAVAFRAFCQTGLKVYPTNDKRKKTFDVADENTTSRMMIFKDGVLQQYNNEDIIDIPTDKDAWFKIIEHFFKDEEKKPEPEPK